MDDNVVDIQMKRIEKEFDYLDKLADSHYETLAILEEMVKLEPTDDNIDLIVRTRKHIRYIKGLK